MASSEALLPVSLRKDPSSDSRSGLNPAIHRRRSVKVYLAVYSCPLLFVLYVLLITTRKNGANDETAAESRARLAGVSEKRVSYDRKMETFPWQRTAFHFQPEKNWITGPLFYKGWYHFFYQYNPNGTVGGDIVWGHAVSKDLIHWLHLPLAMVPDQWYDAHGLWTGSTTVLDFSNSAGLRYDYGKYYASKTFHDQNKGRRILWGWIGESDSEAADVQKGWSSVQGIPRTVQLDTKTGKNLVQWPVEEIESLRLTSKKFDMGVEPRTLVPVDVGVAAQLDIEAEFEIKKEDIERLLGDDSVEAEDDFSCETSGGATVSGALGPFGFSVLADESLSEQTTVYFYVTKGTDSKLKTFFCTDTLRSATANDVVKGIYGSFVPVLKGEKFTMRILVDHSIVEGFGQGGRTCITTTVYPVQAIYGATRLFLFNNAFNATVTASFKVWQMNNAFIHRHSTGDLSRT